MVIFPPGFTKTRFPGYFYNVFEKKLYTIKGGTLRPMVKKNAYHTHPEGYTVSHEGHKRFMSTEYLERLKCQSIEFVDNLK